MLILVVVQVFIQKSTKKRKLKVENHQKMRSNGNIFPNIDSTKSAAMFKTRTQYDEPNFKMRLS